MRLHQHRSCLQEHSEEENSRLKQIESYEKKFYGKNFNEKKKLSSEIIEKKLLIDCEDCLILKNFQKLSKNIKKLKELTLDDFGDFFQMDFEEDENTTTYFFSENGEYEIKIMIFLNVKSCPDSKY